jgi:26S proteasome regulatory subunit N2
MLTIFQANIIQPTGGVILLTDTKPSEPKTLLELKVKKAAPAPTPGGAGPSGNQAPTGGQEAPTTTTANEHLVDEGSEEASLPGDFDYQSDGEEED